VDATELFPGGGCLVVGSSSPGPEALLFSLVRAAGPAVGAGGGDAGFVATAVAAKSSAGRRTLGTLSVCCKPNKKVTSLRGRLKREPFFYYFLGPPGVKHAGMG
jgi:hypothetical protein